MKIGHYVLCLLLGFLLSGCLISAQTQAPPRVVNPVVPQLVSFSGRALDAQRKSVSATVGITFAIYKEQYEGSSLWLETQNVQTDAKGNYTVQLGATKAEGLPLQLFSSGEARWLGVSINGEAELPRVLLLSVPYALKAADAQTLGGLPPSAFMLAAPAVSPSPTPEPSATAGQAPSVGGSGTPGFLPVWSDSSDLGNSIFFQAGSGSSAKVGVNLKNPLATLDVNGETLVRGTLEPVTKGFATSKKGFNSNPLDLEASSFNSNTQKAVMQHFEWQAEPTGNNTGAPAATLNLLFGQDTNTPAETGLKLSNSGLFTFAPGQTFPGTGTIMGITAGTDLTGGGSSGNVTLNLDTTKVPQLGTANTFAGTQTISSGDLSLTSGALDLGASTDSTHGVIRQQGGVIFHSCCGASVFLGQGAGNLINTGNGNVGVGPDAMPAIVSGLGNAAVGEGSMAQTTTGSFNTAVGVSALSGNIGGSGNTGVGGDTFVFMANEHDNTAIGQGAGGSFGGQTSGSQNTFVGFQAGVGSATGTLTDATALGANANAAKSFTVALGGTGNDAVTVAIGTSTPFSDYSLDVENSGPRINSGVVVNATGGNLYLGMTKGTHKFRVDTNGEVFADGGYQSSGADFAESVAVHGSNSLYEPGDLLVIERGAQRRLNLSHTPYSTLVAGIYSTKPGLLATPHAIDDKLEGEVPLAIVGIVPCKVTTENGPIREGDLLVTSSRAGYAMKGTNRRRMLGAVVGKAMEPLARGNGVIQVLVTLQ